MGLVKSYLGYYHEAIEHFKESISYFEAKTKGDYHPNALYNAKKAISTAYINLQYAIKTYKIVKG
jgi:hypothetical protein